MDKLHAKFNTAGKEAQERSKEKVQGENFTREPS
jgi:hypothetical protein